MELFIARQPILKVNHEIYAYELLYRSNKENNFSTANGDQSTLDVIQSFIQIGIEDLSQGRPCFVNFTDNLLKIDIPTYFQPDMLVVEILETVTFTDEIINTCQKLKDKGYKIALDDFEIKNMTPNLQKILNLVDIIKIDIQKTAQRYRQNMISVLKNVEFLAEKVETREQYEQCVKEGFTYFQGYFFSKPIILSTNNLEIQNNTYYLVLAELSKEEPDIDKITNTIEKDISISYKLLKLVNSPLFRRYNEIKSLKQAIVLLGFVELKKWMYLLYIRGTVKKPEEVTNEIIKMSLTRAKASELIAINSGKQRESSSYFLLGILSLIDTIMKQPVEKLLNQLPLDKDIKNTLLGYKTPYLNILDLVISVERGEWSKIKELAEEEGIDNQELFNIYKDSLKWTKEVLEAS